MTVRITENTKRELNKKYHVHTKYNHKNCSVTYYDVLVFSFKILEQNWYKILPVPYSDTNLFIINLNMSYSAYIFMFFVKNLGVKLKVKEYYFLSLLHYFVIYYPSLILTYV